MVSEEETKIRAKLYRSLVKLGEKHKKAILAYATFNKHEQIRAYLKALHNADILTADELEILYQYYKLRAEGLRS